MSQSIDSTSPNASRRPISAARRKIATQPQDWVTVGLLESSRPLVACVQPAVDGIDAVAWASAQRAYMAQLVAQHGAVLLRGFPIGSAERFASFVHATSDGPLLEYRDRSTPRENRGQRVYTSTVYPQNETIRLHNEGTYWIEWPRKLYFFCSQAPHYGGETPLADVAAVYRRLDPVVRERFECKGMMLVRNYNDGFGLPWQEVFQTDDRAAVEAYCATNHIELEWKRDGRLRTRQVRPAVRRHPESGAPLWFNHAAFFHVSSLPEEVREPLLAQFGEDGLPYNTYYGDGTAIGGDEVAAIHAAYAAETQMFPWRSGDLLLIDNMRVAHGRQPYGGGREVLVAMTEAYRQ